MKIEPASEQEALDSLPETFDLVEGERELTAEELGQAILLVLEETMKNPQQEYFKIILD